MNFVDNSIVSSDCMQLWPAEFTFSGASAVAGVAAMDKQRENPLSQPK
jgi:hypothetical protein